MTLQQQETLRKALIQQILEKKPELKAFIEQFHPQQEPSVEPEPVSPQDLLEDNRLLLQELKTANSNNQALIDLVKANKACMEDVALALGACSVCFGKDPDCGDCAGQGKPGKKPVNRHAFETLIVPVLQKLNY